MPGDRKPKTVVMLVELEDNCGAVLAKAKVEIPVSFDTPLSGNEAENLARVRNALSNYLLKIKSISCNI